MSVSVDFLICAQMQNEAKFNRKEAAAAAAAVETQMGIGKKWQTHMHARTAAKRASANVNDDVWKFMDESIDDGVESVLLLAAHKLKSLCI